MDTQNTLNEYFINDLSNIILEYLTDNFPLYGLELSRDVYMKHMGECLINGHITRTHRLFEKYLEDYIEWEISLLVSISVKIRYESYIISHQSLVNNDVFKRAEENIKNILNKIFKQPIHITRTSTMCNWVVNVFYEIELK